MFGVRKLSSLLMTALGLTLFACGSNGGLGSLGGLDSATSGFRVVQLDPSANQTYVDVVSEVRIWFSESVDESTVASNFKITETTSAGTNDFTSKGTVSFESVRSTSDVLIFTPNSALNPNARYQVTVSTKLKASSGRNLVASVNYRFATGSLDGFGGGVSVDGPPTVVSWQAYSDAQNCLLSIGITFNEDLQYLPRVSYETRSGWPFHTLIAQGEMDASQNPNSSGRRSFILDFPGVTCDFFSIGTSTKLTLLEAFDMQGNPAPSGISRTFYGENL